ncbi:EFR3-like protein, partial [Trifolium pratense]
NSSDDALIQSFQLALSLRSISLNEKGGSMSKYLIQQIPDYYEVKLQPSRRRSLFTLATSMIIFTSKAYNILSLISIAKMSLTDKTVDPFLQLVNDSKLQAVADTTRKPSKVYGSNEDDEDALNALSSIKLTESQSNESCATMIVQSLEKPADESSMLKEQLLNKFTPDDACPLGVQLSLDTTGNAY